MTNDEISDHSNLKRYCIGIVAMNKKLFEDRIEVFPIEHAALLEGDLTDKWDEVVVKGKDGEIQDYENSTKFTKTIKASWAGMYQYNRLTSPDVRRGEKVQVYRLGDSNVFYWDTLDTNRKIRRLETVIYGFSATKQEDEDMTPDNTYVQGVSTHEHMVTLIYTSKHPTNKEKFRYGIFIDTRPDQSHIVIKDDIGNRIVLQSLTNSIRMETAKGAYVHIDNERITSKGSWYHKGTVSIEDDVFLKKTLYAEVDVIANNVSLHDHPHPDDTAPIETVKTLEKWDPHSDKLPIDYRKPEWLK